MAAHVLPVILVQPTLGSRDWRQWRQTTGVVRDQVVLKANATAPETPFANARIWLLRLADGRKAWDGYSDAQGRYTATGLEVGVAYIAVGIDPHGVHKATGAGPVTAVEAT